MSNWTSINEDSLKAAEHGDVIDAAQTTATGGSDPVAESIEGAVARVRGAISVGNTLDADPSKVPKSLKALTVRLAAFALMERLQIELNTDQRDTKKNDQSYLNRIIDSKIRFETPDIPAGSAEMQQGMSAGTVPFTPRQGSRRALNGLL